VRLYLIKTLYGNIIILVTILGLGIYVLILAIKALKIYINKNS